MKKILVVAAALLVSFASFAYEDNRDAQGNIQKGPYETNEFFDNFFVGAGLGVNVAMDNFSGIIKKGVDLETGFAFPALDLYIGKWLEPCYGVRFGWQGLADNIYDTDFNFNYFHFDFLWNINNFFWGYKEDRFYSAIPYLHGGFAKTKYGKGMAGGFGLLNNFRLTEPLALTLDLRATGANTDLIPVQTGNYVQTTATLGIVWTFGKKNWTRKSTSAAEAAAAVAAAEAAAAAAEAAKQKAEANEKALADQNKALADENQALKDQLGKGGNGAAFDELLSKPMIVYFEIGQATLSNKEKAHLDYVVKNIVSKGEGVKFTVSGNADSKTGTKARNAQLAQQRADYLFKLLTGEYGLSADQFEVKSNGGNDIFSKAELNRAVIIEKK